MHDGLGNVAPAFMHCSATQRLAHHSSSLFITRQRGQGIPRPPLLGADGGAAEAGLVPAGAGGVPGRRRHPQIRRPAVPAAAGGRPPGVRHTGRHPCGPGARGQARHAHAGALVRDGAQHEVAGGGTRSSSSRRGRRDSRGHACGSGSAAARSATRRRCAAAQHPTAGTAAAGGGSSGCTACGPCGAAGAGAVHSRGAALAAAGG